MQSIGNCINNLTYQRLILGGTTPLRGIAMQPEALRQWNTYCIAKPVKASSIIAGSDKSKVARVKVWVARTLELEAIATNPMKKILFAIRAYNLIPRNGIRPIRVLVEGQRGRARGTNRSVENTAEWPEDKQANRG
jgi:hypothetical protein